VNSSTGKANTFEIDSARLWDLPDTPVPIGVAVSGESRSAHSTRWRITSSRSSRKRASSTPDVTLGRRRGLPGDYRVIGQIPVCWDTAVKRAHDQFRWFAGGWPVNADLPTTAGFAGGTTGRPGSPTSHWCRSVTSDRTGF
jgi:hypothetical protein